MISSLLCPVQVLGVPSYRMGALDHPAPCSSCIPAPGTGTGKEKISVFPLPCASAQGTMRDRSPLPNLPLLLLCVNSQQIPGHKSLPRELSVLSSENISELPQSPCTGVEGTWMLTHQGNSEAPLRPSCCKGEPWICWQPEAPSKADVLRWVVDKGGVSQCRSPPVA